MTKEILFSVTASDCDWSYTRGSGKGGQKRNKTSSHCRCTHRDSGAVGQSDDTRSQHQNKRIAFQRMAESDEFKTWHKIEVAKATGLEGQIKERVENQMKSQFLKVEFLGSSEFGINK